jgi:hypothetical protein
MPDRVYTITEEDGRVKRPLGNGRSVLVGIPGQTIPWETAEELGLVPVKLDLLNIVVDDNLPEDVAIVVDPPNTPAVIHMPVVPASSGSKKKAPAKKAAPRRRSAPRGNA